MLQMLMLCQLQLIIRGKWLSLARFRWVWEQKSNL